MEDYSDLKKSNKWGGDKNCKLLWNKWDRQTQTGTEINEFYNLFQALPGFDEHDKAYVLIYWFGLKIMQNDIYAERLTQLMKVALLETAMS